jgi:2-dehydropantoate 2-reductase
MKIAIIGTGGVGGYFGAKLAQHNHEVTFLARGKHLETIKNNGLTIKSINGDFTVTNIKATDKITNIEAPDLVLIGVKAWQIKEIREELNTILHSESLVVPLQNGVLAVEELSEAIDAKRILGGLCRIFGKIEAPGIIRHMGVTPTIVFGEMDGTISSRAQMLQELFEKAGIKSKLSDDINAELWKKFIAICVSGLLAVSKTNYGELREMKETRQMMMDLFNEIYALSQKMGINIASNFVDKTVAFIDSFPADSTSSLTRDVWEGKPSEIEYQNGTVVKLGEKHGVATPVNRFVYNCILPMERKARGK